MPQACLLYGRRAGDYVVAVIVDTLSSTPSRPAFTIRSQGASGNQTALLESDVVPQSFADFLYYTNAERQPSTGKRIWFCSFDRMDGAIHTNDQLNIMGDPVFEDEVTSAFGGPDDNNPNHDPSFMYYNGDYYNDLESADASNPPFDEPTFEDGYALGASEIALPNNLNAMRSVAQNGGICISGTYSRATQRTTPTMRASGLRLPWAICSPDRTRKPGGGSSPGSSTLSSALTEPPTARRCPSRRCNAGAERISRDVAGECRVAY